MAGGGLRHAGGSRHELRLLDAQLAAAGGQRRADGRADVRDGRAGLRGEVQRVQDRVPHL